MNQSGHLFAAAMGTTYSGGGEGGKGGTYGGAGGGGGSGAGSEAPGGAGGSGGQYSGNGNNTKARVEFDDEYIDISAGGPMPSDRYR